MPAVNTADSDDESRRMGGPVNTAHWINAVDAHPETLDTDLLVAVALANGETSVEGVPQERADDSVEELLALGFLELVLVDGDEYVMELRYP